MSDHDLDYIRENFYQIENILRESARKSGRKPEDVTLLAVSKTFPPEFVKFCADLGIVNFGENRVTELLDKQAALSAIPSLKWHLIGHLQRNKVKSVIGKTELIHSLDSLRLAEEINRRAKEAGTTADCLIEVNIAEEPSKYGVPPSDVADFVNRLRQFDGVHVKGLMCVAPFVEDPEENRGRFAKMRNLFLDIGRQTIDNIDMQTLSMGMTNDFAAAVEEGATIVRVGAGLFGRR